MSDKEKINENEVLENEVKENVAKDEALEKAREARKAMAARSAAVKEVAEKASADDVVVSNGEAAVHLQLSASLYRRARNLDVQVQDILCVQLL